MKWYLIESINKKLDAEYKQRINDIQSYIKSIAPKRKEIFKKLCKIVKIGMSPKHKENFETFCMGFKYESIYNITVKKIAKFLSGEIESEILPMTNIVQSMKSVTMGGWLKTTSVFNKDYIDGESDYRYIEFDVKEKQFTEKLSPETYLELAYNWTDSEVKRQLELGNIAQDDCSKHYFLEKYRIKTLMSNTEEVINEYEKFINDFYEKFQTIPKLKHDCETIKKEVEKFFGNISKDNSTDISYIRFYIKKPKNCRCAKGSVYIDNNDFNTITQWWKSLRPKLSCNYSLGITFENYYNDITIAVSRSEDDPYCDEHNFHMY